MRINTNIMALNASRNLAMTGTAMGKTLEKLSSGSRINRAADDAAGLVVSQSLRAQVSGLRQATRNAQDGISVVQTAEGALTEVHTMLNRMRDLAVQASNTGANDATAVAAAQSEFDQLALEITRISGTTSFGGTKLLDGTYTAKTFQVGANSGETILVSVGNTDAATLGVAALNLSTGAAAALTAIDTAISTVSSARADLGATQNRFESVINNLSVTSENLAASESRIRDTDYAQEMVSFTRSQILSQAGTAMLGQANQVPQSVLSLLRG